MQFAINYSPQAAELLGDGRIEIDRFKCPDWPDLIATAHRYRPVCVHFDLRAGAPEPESIDWDAVARLADQTGTPTINLHLNARRDEYPRIPFDSADPAHLDAITAALLRDVQAAVARFGPERVIVENIPYRGSDGQSLRASIEPEVLGRVVAETSCGLLLDISHGLITAYYLGLDGQAYLDSLPVAHLREVHITGIKWIDGQPRDHLDLSDSDWAAFGWALARIAEGRWAAPWLVAFEYGGVGPIFEWRSEARVIAEQVPPLYDMVKQAAVGG